jgi:hypothetical protein
MRRPNFSLLSLAFAFALAGAAEVSARSLVVYCSHDPDACELAAQTFQRETGIETAISRKPTGEFYAQIRAERIPRSAGVCSRAGSAKSATPRVRTLRSS